MAPNREARRIEQEWRKGCAAEEIKPKKPDRHFVKFCQSWFEKRGRLKSEVAYVKSPGKGYHHNRRSDLTTARSILFAIGQTLVIGGCQIIKFPFSHGLGHFL